MRSIRKCHLYETFQIIKELNEPCRIIEIRHINCFATFPYILFLLRGDAGRAD